MVKLINQPIVFALELIMLYSFGHFAYSKGINSFSRVAFTIAAIVLGGGMVPPGGTKIRPQAPNALPGSFQGRDVSCSSLFPLSASNEKLCFDCSYTGHRHATGKLPD